MNGTTRSCVSARSRGVASGDIPEHWRSRLSLCLGARPLRGHRQQVELNIAVLGGQAKTVSVRGRSDITVLSSDEFWERISGISDFRARLLRASTILAWLVKRRSADEAARIKAEAILLFGDADGRLDLEALANPPRTAREENQALLARALDETPDS